MEVSADVDGGRGTGLRSALHGIEMKENPWWLHQVLQPRTRGGPVDAGRRGQAGEA